MTYIRFRAFLLAMLFMLSCSAASSVAIMTDRATGGAASG